MPDFDLARVADQLQSTNQILLRVADALDDIAEAQWQPSEGSGLAERLLPQGRPSQRQK